MDSIQAPCEHVYEVKKSLFFGFVFPVANEDEAKAVIVALRQRFKDANHVCWAYRLDEGRLMRQDDDGEPKHTAGLPMLGVLEKQDLTNVCAVVVRAFGGIKLGASGLVRAYTKAVSEALTKALRVQKVTLVTVAMSLTYAEHHRCDALLHTSLEAVTSTYTDTITLQGTLQETSLGAFNAALNELTQRPVELKKIVSEEVYR